jgi:hypothetical protein
MVYPKHDLTLNKHVILRVEQKTTKVNAQVKVLKINPSYLTCVITLRSKPKKYNKSFT